MWGEEGGPLLSLTQNLPSSLCQSVLPVIFCKNEEVGGRGPLLSYIQKKPLDFVHLINGSSKVKCEAKKYYILSIYHGVYYNKKGNILNTCFGGFQFFFFFIHPYKHIYIY